MSVMKLEKDEYSADDAASPILKQLDEIATWTKKKLEIFETLLAVIKDEKYIQFSGDFRTYDLQTKGAYAIYQIPIDQRGNQRPLAGKKVRIICIGYNGGSNTAAKIFTAKEI